MAWGEGLMRKGVNQALDQCDLSSILSINPHQAVRLLQWLPMSHAHRRQRDRAARMSYDAVATATAFLSAYSQLLDVSVWRANVEAWTEFASRMRLELSISGRR
jgi:hypothetical protein